MSVLTEPKIDCHNHVTDPARFPYQPDTPYRPAGAEIGTAAQFQAVCDTYNVRHALIVGPNSGYGMDNRCLLDIIRQGGGRFKGIAVVANDAPIAELEALQAAGIVGVAINPTIHGVAYYRNIGGLLDRLAGLDMFLQIQTEHAILVELMPLLESTRVKLLIDHCGRPDITAGVTQPGFQALLALGRSGRASVKISGFGKFTAEPFPHADTWPYVRALVDAFSLDRCVWGSDWPYLRATQRIDYGPLVVLAERLFPDPAERRKLFWVTPRRLFDFT